MSTYLGVSIVIGAFFGGLAVSMCTPPMPPVPIEVTCTPAVVERVVVTPAPRCEPVPCERVEDFGDDDFPQLPASAWRDLP